MDVSPVAALFQVLQERRRVRVVGRQAVLEYEAPGRCEYSRYFAQESRYVGEVVRCDAAGDRLEAGVGEGQGGGLGVLHQDIFQTAFRGQPPGRFEHAGRDVGGDHQARRPGHA